MLNELLLALLGFTGPIFQLDTITNSIKLASDGNQFPFLHQSEKLQLAQICEIATLYYHLNRQLITAQQNSSSNNSGPRTVAVAIDGTSADVYRTALQNGARVLLEPYRRTISKFSLSNNVPLLTLSYILSELKIYKLLFENLLHVVRSDHTMLTLFPHVHHMASSGNPIIKHSGIHLCKYLNRVTLFQMQKFLIGDDTHHHSFWIQRSDRTHAMGGSGGGSSMASIGNYSGISVHSNNQTYHSNGASYSGFSGMSGASGFSGHSIFSHGGVSGGGGGSVHSMASTSTTTSSENVNWSNEYHVVTENIPPPLTVPLCRKFLFVANVLHVLKRKSDIDDTLRAGNYSREWYSQLQALSEFEQPTTFANQLELVITKMYNQVTVYLWDILCGRDVKALFHDLRRCFLLDGDIFQVWLAAGALSVLQQNTRLFADSSSDLARLFQMQEDEFACMEHVSITTVSKLTPSVVSTPNHGAMNSTVPHQHHSAFSPSSVRSSSSLAHSSSTTTTTNTTSTGMSTSGSLDELLHEISKMKDQWHSQLQINARIKWPLSLLITEEVFELYNQIWQFLLLIKRVQMELNDCYMILTKSSNGSNIVRSRQQQLHMIMNFLVDHIWYYLGVDVIGAQFSEFESLLDKCQSFQACKVQHEQFLMRIHKSMFLGKSGQVVRATLLKLLDIIMTFTHVVRTEQIDTYLHEIDQHWRRQMTLFWNLLENSADRELSVLCLRIDYNGWFSRAPTY